MGDSEEITTWPHQHSLFYKVTNSALSFEVKGHLAVIVLSEHPKEGREGGGSCKIQLGNQSFIENCNCMVETQGLLSRHEYRGFWVAWFGKKVRVGRAGQEEPFITLAYTAFDDPLMSSDGVALQYVHFGMEYEFRRDEPVSWRFAISPVKICPKEVKRVKGGKAEWIQFNDLLPDNALIGGYCKERQEKLYIIRAKHRGSVTPGKFVPSEGLGYVSWGGDANEKETFEVLCGFNVQWVPTRSKSIPAGAIAGGYSEDRGEVLYVGRAYHEGHLIPGKVQPSHKVCYIPFEDSEIAKEEYEILVDPEHVQRPF